MEEGGEQDEFMLNAPMKQPSDPNESNRRCINTPGEANTRIHTHTHTSTDNSNKLSVFFLCCWPRPKMCYYKKMREKKNTFLVCFWRRTQRTWTKRQVQATLQRNRRCISCHRRFPLWVFFLLAHVYVIMTLFLLTSHVKRMCCTLLHHVARWCSPQEKSRYTQLLTIEKGKKEKKKKRSTSFLTCSFRASNVWKQK